MQNSDLIRAADVSKYAGFVNRTSWASAKRKHGIELAIVGSWHGKDANDAASDTLKAAHDSGLTTATYIVLNELLGSKSIDEGLRACGNTPLAFVALDIELRGVTQEIIEDAIRECHAHLLRVAIYTGEWFWQGRLGNPVWFPRIPLWHSSYNGKEELEPVNYGGWDIPVGHQYKGTDSSLGFSADLSMFNHHWVEK